MGPLGTAKTIQLPVIHHPLRFYTVWARSGHLPMKALKPYQPWTDHQRLPSLRAGLVASTSLLIVAFKTLNSMGSRGYAWKKNVMHTSGGNITQYVSPTYSYL
ncbi:hypothetical protein D3C78_810060 [compost metagenome]